MKFKNFFKSKLLAAKLLFAFVGCFILAITIFGEFFEAELIALEKIIEDPKFIWGLRIFVLIFIIFAIKKKDWLRQKFEKPGIKMALRVFYFAGILGWIAALLEFAK